MRIRRSNLIVPGTDVDAINAACRQNADAVTIDLERSVAPSRRAEARNSVKQCISVAAQGAAEVFVRVNKSILREDLEASVWPGLSGIMLPSVDTAAEVSEAAKIMTALERERGIAADSLELIVLLDTASGIWNVREIVTASSRIFEVGLDESELAADLEIDALADCDPFVYARGRLVFEAVAAKRSPLGMVYPLSVEPRLLDATELQELSVRAKNTGMKGVICPHASWVEPVNKAFTPTAESVAYYQRVRAAFAEGVASGTAAVALDGRMLDVPVNEWAKVVIATAEACAKRDAEKREAWARLSR